MCVCVGGGGVGGLKTFMYACANIHCSSCNSDSIVMETTNQIAHPGLLNDVGPLANPVEEIFLTHDHKHVPGVEGGSQGFH